MKKTKTLSLVLLLLLMCGCTREEEKQYRSQTRILLDTVVEISAECDEETLNGAFALSEKLESVLSRTKEGSDVYELNKTDGFVKVTDDTRAIIEKAVYYSDVSGGRFDITICPVSELWDFKNQVIPSPDEIAEALQSVDYHSLQINGNYISLGEKKIDLGGIAKGYITDEIVSYFKAKGVERALINLGGNVYCMGEFTVGIKKPFEESVMLTMQLSNKSAVTSGIYERCIEKDGKLFHHVIDPKTGYGVENELASVTVIGESSFDCDALSTVCLLLGTEEGRILVESTPDIDAVFIDREGYVSVTSGLHLENDKIYIK